MKSLDDWLSEYDVSHQNEENKVLHFICVPLIFLTVVTLSMEIRLPGLVSNNSLIQALYSLAGVIIIGGLFFYFRLSLIIFSLMIPLITFCVSVGVLLQQYGINLEVSLTVFVLAWIGQFIGHKIEGEKPSFFKDLQFLFIGPVWCMVFLLRKWKINY